MDKIKPTLLPEGTILTTEGKDKILTGKLQRAVAWALANHGVICMTLAALSARMLRRYGTPAQNVHRTVKVLEDKGVLKTVKGVKGEVTLYHCLGVNREGKIEVTVDVEEYYGLSEAHMPGGVIVGNHDYVAAIVDAVKEGRGAEVFKTAKPVSPDNKRWLAVTLNKPALYKLAAREFNRRVDVDGVADASQEGRLGPLIEQAARGAWQPFFDTLRKNKIITYHDTQEGRLMVWDNRRWVVYRTRVMREREVMMNSWWDRTAMHQENARLAAEANAEFTRNYKEKIAKVIASAQPDHSPF